MGYPKQNRKFRIFVVDDEEIIASTIAAILRLKGFDAAAFTAPLEALAASQSRPPDMLVSDIVMPSLSGTQLAFQIQADHPGCKVLLFSGQWEAADLEIARYDHVLVFEMLPKPVHPKDLIKKVQEMLSSVPSVPGSGEDRARKRLIQNMKETIAAVQADIAVSSARKRTGRRRVPRENGE